MPVVSSVVSDPRGSGGVTVHLDGASFALVAASDVRALKLAPGRELTPAQVAALEQRSEVFAARAAAMRILGYRPLPSGELQRRLVRKGYAAAAVGEAVGALVRAGLVDDRGFARHFVKTRASRLRYGPGRLERDLRRLGIAEGEARRAVAEGLAEDGVDPGQLLREAARKKLATLRGLEPRVRGRRLRIYLRRRGFSLADVNEVVKEALAG